MTFAPATLSPQGVSLVRLLKFRRCLDKLATATRGLPVPTSASRVLTSNDYALRKVQGLGLGFKVLLWESLRLVNLGLKERNAEKPSCASA